MEKIIAILKRKNQDPDLNGMLDRLETHINETRKLQQYLDEEKQNQPESKILFSACVDLDDILSIF